MVNIYRIQVRGHLGDRWSVCLGDLQVERQSSGTTDLIGPVEDQAALYGVIMRIRDLGLSLLSINVIGERPAVSQPPDPPHGPDAFGKGEITFS